ncbi:MAG: glucokinase [Desulfovibrio sp.]|uniref:glucokinase n=1 Tax=Desulfovibrio sp. TaxID=885 RepID=UPI0039E47737
MQRILVADVGGTNCRFGSFIFENNTLALEFSTRINSSSLGSAQALFTALSEELSLPIETAAAIVVGLAGPVDGQRGRLTNGNLDVDLAEVPALRHVEHCLLLNDFTLQAYAMLTPPGTHALSVADSPIGKALESAGKLRPTGAVDSGFLAGNGRTRAIIGAGTGLGAASLLSVAGRGWIPFPSESGHAAFAFLGEEEQEYRRFLCRELGRPFVSAENVLCGDGLAILHYYLTGQLLKPEQVGAQALGEETPTLRWYARFLGRFCRGWMLSTLCSGGLWIAGGIAAANPRCVTSSVFSEALRSYPGVNASLLKDTPVYLVTDTDSGLWGAAFAGQAMLQANGQIYSNVQL